MNKFVVYLVNYSGDKLPRYYIGSTSYEKIKSGYLGSVRSKKWKEIFKNEVKNNINLFNVEILSTHNTRKDALLEEYKIQKKYNVVESTDYFNESFATVDGFFGRDVSGEANTMYGRKDEIIAININTKEKVRVSKEEFENNDDLFGHTIGLVSVIDINSGKKVTINKDEFEINRDKYKHHNDGKKHTLELREKLSKMRVGFITARDWNGNFHRIHKDDERLKNGILGNTTSKRWIITDLDGNEYKTFNFVKFFSDNNLQYPRPENIIEGIIKFRFKLKKNNNKSTNGWKVICLDK